MTCPHLEYRDEDETVSFDHERPYCAIQETFVSPMQADVCNDRFGFSHASDCDVYRRAVEAGDVDGEVDELRESSEVEVR
jgi:hypothetical protein